MQRRKPTNDAELAEQIGVRVDDRTAQMVGRRYSDIETEEQRIPWLKRRRRRWQRQPRSSS